MILITDAVRDKLAAVDPGHAADYTERAAALTQDLTRLDQSFADGPEILPA
jgi:ABC-type Zn uptake system ZnuABC Zn-binding protein ZnuA